MSLKINNIAKSYGNKKVLKEVSFSVGDGEIAGFLGPNGAGKSTLMKIITGYVTPDSGSVEVCGIASTPNEIEAKKVIGYLPEHNPLYLDMYVREFLSYVADFYNIKNKKARVEEMIERTGLTPEAHKRISQLSKGYRQRVGLAQALIHDPKVLILDEPTTGLDPNQLVEIRKLIAEVGKEKTVLFSTHIMQEVTALCDRVVIINHGEIVADGDVKATAAQFAQGFVFEVQFGDNEKESEEVFQGIATTRITHLGTNHYQITAESDIREQLFKNAIEHKRNIITLKQVEMDMETLFKQLTADK